jgi:hypothetical protein
VVELHAAEHPYDEHDDQQKAENATGTSPAIATIAVVSTAAAEQNNQQDDEKYCSHNAPLLLTGWAGMLSVGMFYTIPSAEMSAEMAAEPPDRDRQHRNFQLEMGYEMSPVKHT